MKESSSRVSQSNNKSTYLQQIELANQKQRSAHNLLQPTRAPERLVIGVSKMSLITEASKESELTAKRNTLSSGEIAK